MMKDVTVVWDWNGTLLDDVALNCAIMNRMLRKRGKDPISSLEVYRQIFGFPIKGYYERAGFDFTQEDYETVADEYMALYRRDSMECRLFPGARQVLSDFKDRNVRQVILSASHKDCLMEQLAHLKVESMFDEVLALSHCLAHSKAELAEKWMKNNQLSGENLFFVGDTLHDYQVSKRLGAFCVLIAAGHQDKERLLTCGCPVADDLGEAAQLIQKNILAG